MLADAAVVMALRGPQLLVAVVDEARGARLPVALPSALRPRDAHLVGELQRLASSPEGDRFCAPRPQTLRKGTFKGRRACSRPARWRTVYNPNTEARYGAVDHLRPLWALKTAGAHQAQTVQLPDGKIVDLAAQEGFCTACGALQEVRRTLDEACCVAADSSDFLESTTRARQPHFHDKQSAAIAVCEAIIKPFEPTVHAISEPQTASSLGSPAHLPLNQRDACILTVLLGTYMPIISGISLKPHLLALRALARAPETLLVEESWRAAASQAR